MPLRTQGVRRAPFLAQPFPAFADGPVVEVLKDLQRLGHEFGPAGHLRPGPHLGRRAGHRGRQIPEADHAGLIAGRQDPAGGFERHPTVPLVVGPNEVRAEGEFRHRINQREHLGRLVAAPRQGHGEGAAWTTAGG
jgi:hypothetical protein